MVDIQENISLNPYSTFHTEHIARYFALAQTKEDIPELLAFARKKNIPFHIVGEGSNTLFKDNLVNKLIIQIQESYIRIRETKGSETYIDIGAGTRWDEVVAWSVQKNLIGIESLSGIPGTAGAAPIQNIGAYGQEIRDTLTTVSAYDTKENKFVSIPNSECGFGYRTSIFKEADRGKYIIIALTLQLRSELPHIPTYPDIQDYFNQQSILHPTLLQIRDAILLTRSQKLPNPNIIPNVGSFFKNPIITTTHAQELQKRYPHIKLFPINEAQTKVPAGWLIEQCGLKGSTIGPVGIYEKNALILTNNGGATFDDIMYAKDTIVKKVFGMFEITLEMEPDCV